MAVNVPIIKRKPKGKRFRSLVGHRYGKLTVLRLVGFADRNPPFAIYECKCECGTVDNFWSHQLRRATSPSCGCMAGQHFKTHGNSSHPLYAIYAGMLDRCYNPNSKSYRNYGGRGIRVCKRWRDSFLAFVADVGDRPSNAHSLDRYPDMNGNYEPSNCRWATAKQQANNMRANRRVTYQGVTKNMTAWARDCGISRERMRQRLNAFSVDRALGRYLDPNWVDPPCKCGRPRKVGKPTGRLSHAFRKLRREVMAFSVRDGASVKRVAEIFGVAEQTVYRSTKEHS